jgi:uncharacterized spore protein YtfJ
MNSQESVVTQIAERVKSSADVRVVYGDPISANGRTIIPVSQVMYGFGGGSGQGEEGSGGGGGGGVQVKPLGVLEMTDNDTRFVPIMDVGRMARYALIGLFLVTGSVRAYLRFLERRRR